MRKLISLPGRGPHHRQNKTVKEALSGQIQYTVMYDIFAYSQCIIYAKTKMEPPKNTWLFQVHNKSESQTYRTHQNTLIKTITCTTCPPYSLQRPAWYETWQQLQPNLRVLLMRWKHCNDHLRLLQKHSAPNGDYSCWQHNSMYVLHAPGIFEPFITSRSRALETQMVFFKLAPFFASWCSCNLRSRRCSRWSRCCSWRASRWKESVLYRRFEKRRPEAASRTKGQQHIPKIFRKNCASL